MEMPCCAALLTASSIARRPSSAPHSFNALPCLFSPQFGSRRRALPEQVRAFCADGTISYETPCAKRSPAKARSAPAEPPAPKHRVDEKGACRYRKRARGGRQVNGVKVVALGSSYEQMPAGAIHGVYLIHRMPDISTSWDAPSPGQSRSLIRPRGRSLQR